MEMTEVRKNKANYKWTMTRVIHKLGVDLTKLIYRIQNISVKCLMTHVKIQNLMVTIFLQKNGCVSYLNLWFHCDLATMCVILSLQASWHVIGYCYDPESKWRLLESDKENEDQWDMLRKTRNAHDWWDFKGI